MEFYLISDNIDTLVGMRLVGIDGIIVHEEDKLKETLKNTVNMQNVAIVLITEKLVKMCQGFIYDFKLKNKRPLVIEIPDRHSKGRAKDSITRYIRDAIGIKI